MNNNLPANLKSILAVDASKVQLGEAARKFTKAQQSSAEEIARAKQYAAADGRKTVNMADMNNAIDALAEEAQAAAAAASKPAKAPKAPKAAKPATQDAPELNWAYRRLRRTALDVITRLNKLEPEDKKAFRAQLETVSESYGALQTFIDVEKNASLQGNMEDILEEFFGHVIHPGSGNHGIRKA